MTFIQTTRVAKVLAIAHLLRKSTTVSTSAQSKIPNQKYVRNFGVNGRMGLAKRAYLSRLNMVGLTKQNAWAMGKLIINDF